MKKSKFFKPHEYNKDILNPKGRKACLCYVKIRLLLCEEAEQHAGSHSRTDHTCNVRAHGMHEQIVGGIIFETEIVGDTCRHRHSRNACVADKRINLMIFRKNEVEELHEKHS